VAHTLFNTLIVFGPFSAILILLGFMRAARIQRATPQPLPTVCPTCKRPLSARLAQQLIAR
jgi:hypothetical protein